MVCRWYCVHRHEVDRKKEQKHTPPTAQSNAESTYARRTKRLHPNLRKKNLTWMMGFHNQPLCLLVNLCVWQYEIAHTPHHTCWSNRILTRPSTTKIVACHVPRLWMLWFEWNLGNNPQHTRYGDTLCPTPVQTNTQSWKSRGSVRTSTTWRYSFQCPTEDCVKKAILWDNTRHKVLHSICFNPLTELYKQIGTSFGNQHPGRSP